MEIYQMTQSIISNGRMQYGDIQDDESIISNGRAEYGDIPYDTIKN